MDLRKHEPCEICKTRQATEWHHCIFKRKKGDNRRNAIFNLQHVCQTCHMNEADSYSNKSAFWWKQYRKHGADFLRWYDELAEYPPREYAEERERVNASS